MAGKLHLIMPMGGGGTRFGSKGFHLPKPLIPLRGKPFFYWAARSVLKFTEVQDITFVVLQEHIDGFQIDQEILSYFPDAKIVVIPHVLNGAVLTCLEGIRGIKDDNPILFNDCDHAFLSDELYDYISNGNYDLQGALLTFSSDDPCYSYVRFDESGTVNGTVEKQVVSNKAICGAYLFGNREIFEKAAARYLKNCDYKEFFISGVYNELAKDGAVIGTFSVEPHLSFGTPDEYDLAVFDERFKLLE